MSVPTYAATGATGHFGHLAVLELLAGEVPASDIVAVVRDRGKASGWPHAALAHIAYASMLDGTTRPTRWQASTRERPHTTAMSSSSSTPVRPLGLRVSRRAPWACAVTAIGGRSRERGVGGRPRPPRRPACRSWPRRRRRRAARRTGAAAMLCRKPIVTGHSRGWPGCPSSGGRAGRGYSGTARKP